MPHDTRQSARNNLDLSLHAAIDVWTASVTHKPYALDPDFDLYSGLKNCCNVFQFWSGCDVALEKARMTLSVGLVK